MPIKDIKGKRFGRLLVKELSHIDKHKKAHWVCICDCGEETVVLASNLRTGRTTSCGCYRKEIEKIASVTHGLSRTDGKVNRLYSIWLDMKKRCNNKKNKEFKNYGARGIKVCEEWIDDYPAFHEWAIQNGYNENLTLDRIDVDGDYSPDNCKWSTLAEQAKNKRISPRNTTGVSGVTYKKSIKKYTVRIGVNGRRIYIGDYKTLEEAKEARKLAEKKYWG